MTMWTANPRCPSPASFHAPVVPAPVKLATYGGRIVESSMDAVRHRITFVGQGRGVDTRDCDTGSAVRDTSHHVEAVPELSYDLGTLGSVTATITGRVCRSLVEHCRESNLHGREVGGVLVGHCGERSAARNSREHEYDLLVTNAIPICSFDSSNDHLSFTEGAWARAQEEIREKHAPDGKIWLGWYHTHPDQGIFFSNKDRTAHRIFSEPYQFALVVDPRGMEVGLFHWAGRTDKLVKGPICFSLIRRRT